jgi:Flp pilus assembly pilin Flp
MNRFRRITRKNTLIKDDRGLSTVEYVIILVLIAAAAVGTWKTFGGLIKAKLGDSQDKIEKNLSDDTDNNAKESN